MYFLLYFRPQFKPLREIEGKPRSAAFCIPLPICGNTQGVSIRALGDDFAPGAQLADGETMPEPVLTVENLTKSYPAGGKLLPALFPRMKAPRFTALSGVSFSLMPGETLGVLGVNGAGKSTLLKLVAGVSGPTAGRVKVNGSVGALLELGAGFFPEYTGRENALLALRMAGMTAQGAKAILPEIQEFAGIGAFFERPVKTYSSGMFVRLAFSVATAKRPDLLLIDEALSVGDLFFQAKCITRMKEMLSKNTALLFVSHDMAAIKSVCSRCLLLNGGKVEAIGDTEEITARYFSLKVSAEQPAAAPKPETEQEFDHRAGAGRLGDGRARFTAVFLENERGERVDTLAFGEVYTLVMQVKVFADLPEVVLGYHIQTGSGADAVYCDTAIEGKNPKGWKAGETHEVRFKFCARLGEGSHNVVAACSVPLDMEQGAAEFCDHVLHAFQFTVLRRPEAKVYGLTSWQNEVTIT
jgi:lipopolysaccharide transport system ATP-binding protein